jgi:hypothetical protein
MNDQPQAVYFFAPDADHELAHLSDQRVTVLDYDEVTMTSKVVFPNGYRAVVRKVDLVTRNV